MSPHITSGDSAKGAVINIIPIFDTISLYEDISKPYLLMDVAIVESFGLREIIPIIGEEFIHIVASTQGVTAGEGDNTADKDYKKWDSVLDKVFRVTSTSAIVSTSERVKKYVLHCCSVEAIINEKTGLLCDGNSIEDIYSKIDFLLKDEKYKDYGKSAKEFAENFLWDKIITKYKNVL